MPAGLVQHVEVIVSTRLAVKRGLEGIGIHNF